MHGHGGHVASDDRVVNLRNNSMPLSIVGEQRYGKNGIAATPVISGVFGNGAMLIDNNLVISQGANQGSYSYGNTSSSNKVFNTSQELVINLKTLPEVNIEDLSGVLGSTLSTSFKSWQTAERLNTTNLIYQAFTGTTPDPAITATATGFDLGQGNTIEQLSYALQGTQSEPIEESYGNDLSNLPVKDIVTGATKNLYGRNPSRAEIKAWKIAVDEGFDKTLIPTGILLDTDGDDVYRTALLSAASQWNQAQWGTTANLEGSFGQGLVSDQTRFDEVTKPLASVGVLNSFDEAQNEFDTYTKSALSSLTGTPISKSGFF